jgi:diguanylate cyclase
MPARLKLQNKPNDEDQPGAVNIKEQKPGIPGAGERTLAVTDRRDHLYTMALADVACGQIRALRLPADPPSFSVWYAYASNQNPALNQVINEKLRRNGSLSIAELDQLYDRYLSPTNAIDSLDATGKEIGDEVRRLMAVLDAAAGTTGEFRVNLADAHEKLVNGADRGALRAIAANLLAVTIKAERENDALQSKLQSSLQEIGHLQKDLDAARSQSLTDPLTRLGNRLCFDHALESVVAAADRNGDPVSLLLGDIDHFKKFNDSFGHLVGDDVLRLVARELKGTIKGQDIAARYGGEEFAVILPHTGILQARLAAENIRRAVRAKEMVRLSTGGSLGRITISIGVAAYRKGEGTQALIERADRCLYMAKRDGRDRVVAETALKDLPAGAEGRVVEPGGVEPPTS